MVSQPDHHHSSSLALRGAATVVGISTGGGGTNSGGGRHDKYDRYDRHHHSSSHHNHSGSSSRQQHHGGESSTSGARASMTSRSRRYGRSHAGGSTFVPQNEFPIFSHSGDVEIVVRVRSGHENRYLLHRHTLTRCSGFFEASTSNEWSRAQNVPALPSPGGATPIAASSPAATTATAGLVAQGTELARIGEDVAVMGMGLGLGLGTGSELGGLGAASSTSSAATPTGPAPLMKKRWRYELDCGAGDNDIPMLVQKEESSPSSGIAITGSNSNSNSSNSRSSNHNNNAGPANSLFGGGGASAPSSSSSRGHSFFRSVANLSLTHHQYHPTNPLQQQQLRQQQLPPRTQEEQDLMRDYDNLFRIMYNYPPLLDGVNIADAYVQCKSLLGLADLYDALPVVGPRVDHHLLQFQSRLWRQIAKYPISYLRLGYLARSRIIFQEALIHVVGQWPAGERSLRAALPPAVMDLIEDKVDELEEEVSRVESRLFRLNLTTRAGDRVTPHTAYLDWLAVSLFRQWLADNTAPAPPPASATAMAAAATTPAPLAIPDRHRGGAGGGSSRRTGGSSNNSANTSRQVTIRTPQPGPQASVAPAPPLASLGRTYRTLGAASPGAYLGHDECKRFLKLSGELYSRDNLRRFERRVDELKAVAREVVRPLMGSGLELDGGASNASSGMLDGRGGNISSSSSGTESSSSAERGGGKGGGGGFDGGGVAYFTCTRVGERDLPWAVDD